jgi:hypothetical protein
VLLARPAAGNALLVQRHEVLRLSAEAAAAQDHQVDCSHPWSAAAGCPRARFAAGYDAGQHVHRTSLLGAEVSVAQDHQVDCAAA